MITSGAPIRPPTSGIKRVIFLLNHIIVPRVRTPTPPFTSLQSLAVLFTKVFIIFIIEPLPPPSTSTMSAIPSLASPHSLFSLPSLPFVLLNLPHHILLFHVAIHTGHGGDGGGYGFVSYGLDGEIWIWAFLLLLIIMILIVASNTALLRAFDGCSPGIRRWGRLAPIYY